MADDDDNDLLTIDLEADAGAAAKDPIEDLKEQNAALQRERNEAAARAQRAELEAQQARNQVAETQVDAIGNAIAAEEAAISAAKRELSGALAEGDYDKAADAQAVLSTAAAKLVRLQGDKDDAETRKSVPTRSDASADPIEEHIRRTVPPGRSADWLRDHKECLTDPKLNSRMLSAHHDALADGIQPDTDAYFERIETKLGLRGDDSGAARAPAPARKPATPNYSAPPSRDPPSASGRQNTSRITLTRAQADMAESLGMTNAEYAKNLIDARNKGEIS